MVQNEPNLKVLFNYRFKKSNRSNFERLKKKQK